VFLFEVSRYARADCPPTMLCRGSHRGASTAHRGLLRGGSLCAEAPELPSPGLRQPSPPRCRADLQRLMDRRSRSVGFPAPPSTFDLSVGSLASSGDPPAGRCTLPAWSSLVALQSPSRTSPASRSGCPAARTTAMPSFRPSSLEVRRPFDAPSAGNPLPGGFRGRSRSPVPFPRLVAGFHTRFGPPPPFHTTLTACASPHPVACFSHSRPWGSGSRLPGCPTTGTKTCHRSPRG
jgi:hypothetical protein